MGQGRHTLRSISDPVYPLDVDNLLNGTKDFFTICHRQLK